MEWLITVIVIVVIVAVVWWLLSRNRAKTPPGAMAPSAPSPTASSPQIDTTAAALTGSAPLVAATAAAQDLAGSRPVEPEPEPGTDGVDVDDWERQGPAGAAGMAAAAGSPTPGAAMEEPLFEEPTLPDPVLSEEMVGGTVPEAAFSEDAKLTVREPIIPEPVLSEPELEEGVTADDVTADKAEWEATWSEAGAPAAPAPVHHREYTDAHAPTLPGAESAAAEIEVTAPDARQDEPQEAFDGAAAPAAEAAADVVPGDATSLGGHLAADQPYGEGSAAAGADGSGPDGYTVKGSPDTMTYHDEDSPSYDDVKAGVWFVSSAHAEAAGFRPPRRNRR